MSVSSSLGPVTVTLYGWRKVFADVIKVRILRRGDYSWIIQVGPKCSHMYPRREIWHIKRRRHYEDGAESLRQWPWRLACYSHKPRNAGGHIPPSCSCKWSSQVLNFSQDEGLYLVLGSAERYTQGCNLGWRRSQDTGGNPGKGWHRSSSEEKSDLVPPQALLAQFS